MKMRPLLRCFVAFRGEIETLNTFLCTLAFKPIIKQFTLEKYTVFYFSFFLWQWMFFIHEIVNTFIL